MESFLLLFLLFNCTSFLFLVKFFNRLLRGEKMPDEWRKSVLVPLYKDKGDIKECGNYRGIKLMSHTMKLWERIIEARIRKEVTIAEQQFGFMLGRSTTDAIFWLRMLLEKWTEGQKAVHCAFRPGESIRQGTQRGTVGMLAVS